MGSGGTIRTLAPAFNVTPATQSEAPPSSLITTNTAASDPSTKNRAVRVPFALRAERCSASRLPCLMGGPSSLSSRSARRPKPFVAAPLADSSHAPYLVFAFLFSC